MNRSNPKKGKFLLRTSILMATLSLLATSNTYADTDPREGEILIYKGNNFTYDWKEWAKAIDAYLDGRKFSQLTPEEQEELLNMTKTPPDNVSSSTGDDESGGGKLVANDDSFSVGKNTSSNPLTVLSNDTNATSIASIDGVTGGTATISNNVILFTPDSDFTGTAEIIYTATNGQENAQAVATIDVQDSASGWVAWLNNNCTNSTNADITDLNDIASVRFSCTVNEVPPPATAFSVKDMTITFPDNMFNQKTVDSFSNLTVRNILYIKRDDKTEVADLSYLKHVKDAIGTSSGKHLRLDTGWVIYSSNRYIKKLYLFKDNVNLFSSYVKNLSMYPVGSNSYIVYINDYYSLNKIKNTKTDNIKQKLFLFYTIDRFKNENITPAINTKLGFKFSGLVIEANSPVKLSDFPHISYNNGAPSTYSDYEKSLYLGAYIDAKFESLDWLKNMDIPSDESETTFMRFSFYEDSLSDLTASQKLDYNSNYINALINHDNFKGELVIIDSNNHSKRIFDAYGNFKLYPIAKSILSPNGFNGADISKLNGIELIDDEASRTILNGVKKVSEIKTKPRSNIGDLSFLSDLERAKSLYFWEKMPASLSGLKDGLIIDNMLYVGSLDYSAWDGKLSYLDNVYAKGFYLGNSNDHISSQNDGFTKNGVIAKAMRGEITLPIPKMLVYAVDKSDNYNKNLIYLNKSSSTNAFKLGIPGTEKYFAPGFLTGDYSNTYLDIYGMSPEINNVFGDNLKIKHVNIRTEDDIDLSFLNKISDFHIVSFPKGISYTKKATFGTGFCLAWQNGATVQYHDGTMLHFMTDGYKYCQ